jgi:hypothetical protein
VKKPKGARLEVLRSEHFNTEIRFDKSPELIGRAMRELSSGGQS